MNKKNDHLLRLFAIPIGGLLVILFAHITNDKKEFSYVFFGLIVSMIIIYIFKKIGLIDSYSDDEMQNEINKGIFSIIFITSLVIFTLLLVSFYFLGIKSISTKILIKILFLIWLSLVIAKVVAKLYISRWLNCT